MRLLAAGLVLLAQSGYLTGAPVPNFLGLATLAGREAVQMSDDCPGAAPGENVILDDTGGLQIIDPLDGLQPQVCRIQREVHMSDVPCETNPAGDCDIAFIR